MLEVPKNEKRDEKNQTQKEINESIIIFSIPIILSQILNYGICNIYSIYIDAKMMLFSIIIMYAIYFGITALVKKTYKSTCIISVIIFIFTIINNLKLYYTSSPIYISDISFLNNAGGLIELIGKDVIQHLDYIQIIIVIILLIITNYISKKYSINISNKKLRIGIGITILLIFVIMFIPIKTKDQFILEKIYKVNDRKDYNTLMTGIDYYSYHGVLAGMYGIELEGRNYEPDGYNEEDVKKILSEFDNDNNEPEKVDLQKPNIIVMFQESYWDIENIEEIEFDIDITENIDYLKTQGTSVKLLSATYGGMSSNIEYELLTGGNLAYYPIGYNPFLQLYNKIKNTNNCPSIIKELKNNGYNTKIVFGRDYYLSEKVYKKLGIDEYMNEYENMSDYNQKVKGTHLSDEALVDEVINALKNKASEEKLFYMTATIETHMPFDKEKYDKYDIDVVQSSLSEEETGIILSYAQGIYDTNIQIKRLYEEIQKIDEPTILVVLGDHLPYLYNEKGEDILQKLTYFNTENEKINLVRKYITDGIILTNYDTKIEIENEYISPDMLLTSIINQIDVKISSYYKWLYSIKDIIPAQNQYVIIDNSSNIYYSNEILPCNLDSIITKRRYMQYYVNNMHKGDSP